MTSAEFLRQKTLFPALAEEKLSRAAMVAAIILGRARNRGIPYAVFAFHGRWRCCPTSGDQYARAIADPVRAGCLVGIYDGGCDERSLADDLEAAGITDCRDIEAPHIGA